MKSVQFFKAIVVFVLCISGMSVGNAWGGYPLSTALRPLLFGPIFPSCKVDPEGLPLNGFEEICQRDARLGLGLLGLEAEAQNAVGLMYREGRGVLQDDVEAVRWFRKSASQDYAEGLFNLGRMYEEGRGVSRNVEVAKHYYRRAANRGSALAPGRLAALERRYLNWILWGGPRSSLSVQ